MNAITIILTIILILAALALIAAVLLSPTNNSGGLGALSGSAADTFFGKNKAKSLEGKLGLIIKIAAAVILAVAIALVIILRYMTI